MNTVLIETIHFVYHKQTGYELIWGKPCAVFIISAQP